MSLRRIGGAAIIVGLAATTYFSTPQVLNFKPDAITNVPALFGYLVLISLLVERATEIFLSTWRSSGADKLDLELRQRQEALKAAQGNSIEPQQKALAELQHQRTLYRAQSRQMAQWIGLTIGTLVSLVGVRILGSLVEAMPSQPWQHHLFVTLDVLLSGTVLAGGSDAVNKIMKLYTSAMETTAQRMQNASNEK
ncbi:hypothetical protein [Gallaecimonas mangrovi]|uniref:hypothetical protein n=1 Tax=Gallaecimonas mangrovi TaxID=2291597 RepID=UPI000E1FF497|nr:hypothetical protein [Gallaecimonas mangrovi]